MLKPAFGTISMLLTLLIIGIVFVMTIPMLKSTSSSGLGQSSIKQDNVEEQVDEMVKEIEKMRQQSIDYYNEQNQ